MSQKYNYVVDFLKYINQITGENLAHHELHTGCHYMFEEDCEKH